MSDVFISYKREDQPRAAVIVKALKASGLDVWWDPHIEGGTAWRTMLAEKLEQAKCVIVLWSTTSVSSAGAFIHDEAGRAQERGILLPVAIDPVKPPLGFGETQALDLTNWKGDRNDPRFKTLVSAAKAMVIMGKPKTGKTRRKGGGLILPAVGLLLAASVATVAFVPAVRTPVLNAACGTEALSGLCARLGRTAPVDPAEQALWAARTPGRCEGAQAYLARYPEGAFAEAARAALQSKRTIDEPSEAAQVLRLPIEADAGPRAPTEEAARAAALERVTPQAACAGLAPGEGRTVEFAVQPTEWRCESGRGGTRCGFSGQAVCTVTVRHAAPREVCD